MKDLLKKYRHGWILLYFFPYCAWFIYLETAKFDFYEIRCSVDDYIPSIDLFVIPYLLWFVYVALTVSVFFFTDRTDFYRCTAFLFIGMTICLTIFTLFPSTFDRGEEFSDATICGFLVRLIHRIDSNTNVFPSIHCFNSIVCTITYLKSNTFRTTKNSTKKQKKQKPDGKGCLCNPYRPDLPFNRVHQAALRTRLFRSQCTRPYHVSFYL